jgi:5,10-methenyltetrahydrofolate synthetase
MSELTIRQQKQALRKRMRALRDAATPEQRAMWSAAICARVLASPAYQQARVIHCYLPIRSEVDPRPIIEHAFAHGKRVAIPLWQAHTDETLSCEIDTLSEDAFEADAMGLRTPRRLKWVNPDEIDLVLVPLLAFAKLPPLDLSRAESRKGGRNDIPSPVTTGEGQGEGEVPSPGTPGEGLGERVDHCDAPEGEDAWPPPDLPRGVPQGRNSVAPSPHTLGEGLGERVDHCDAPEGEDAWPPPNLPRGVPEGRNSAAPSPGTPGEGWGGGESRYMRLGYGAGFYDRFLRSIRAHRVGLAFALQRVNELPQTDMDTLLDDVITES